MNSRALQIQESQGPGKTRRRARAYQRAAVRCGCWLERDDATVFGTTIDLAQGGLFLRTALPMTPGVEVRVTLQLPGHHPVVADGQVVRYVAPAQGDRPGLGVRFDRLTSGDASLAEFLGVTLESSSDVEARGSAREPNLETLPSE